MTYPLPENEKLRLKALHDLGILDTDAEADFDDLTVLATQIVGVPIALISLVDRDRQWFKSKVGLDVQQTARSEAFCAYTIMGDAILEVEDATKDDRFSANPLVIGDPKIRFYAGMPLTAPGGENIGTLCTIDHVPRKLDDGQRRALKILAQQVMAQLELRRVLRERGVRDDERASLQELSNLLHSCLTIEEACRVIRRCVEELFAEDSGAVYLMGRQRGAIELLVQWGDMEEGAERISRESCWALRRGRSHRVSADSNDLHCRHHHHAERASLCLPMVAQGDAIGLVTLMWKNTPRSETRVEWIHWLAATVADTLAVALAALRLREELRENSIRDPLTDLFNRRYLEETLARELHRVQRIRLPLGILALDLDHFKSLNDNHGHGAGDAVLRAFAKLLQVTFRQDDVVCRSGGEEFLVILPSADASIVMQRAEELRHAVERMQVSFGGKPLPAITVSSGAAIFPQHGTAGAELIHAADIALYQAKQRGRNRVVMTGSPMGASSSGD